MKLRIGALALIFSLIISLSGCQNDVNYNRQDGNKDLKTKFITSVTSDPRTSAKMTKLSEYACDIDSDSKEESIELYTAAQRNAKGEMIWDDGQKWLLVVVDENNFYPLYSDYLQLGQLYFSVDTSGEKNLPTIRMIMTTGAGLKLTEYSFDKEKAEFKMTTPYDAGALNVFFSSIPNY